MFAKGGKGQKLGDGLLAADELTQNAEAKLEAASAAKAKVDAYSSAASKVGGMLGQDVPAVPGGGEFDGALADVGEVVGNVRDALDLAKELAGYANALTMPSPKFLDEVRRESEKNIGLRAEGQVLGCADFMSLSKYNGFGAGVGVFIRFLRYMALVLMLVGVVGIFLAEDYASMVHKQTGPEFTFSMGLPAIEAQCSACPPTEESCYCPVAKTASAPAGFNTKNHPAVVEDWTTLAENNETFWFWFTPFMFDAAIMALMVIVFSGALPGCLIGLQVRWAEAIKGTSLLPTAFTVKISNLPTTRPVSTSELTDLMSNEFGAVESVTVCVQNGEWNKLTARANALNKQIPAMTAAVAAAEAALDGSVGATKDTVTTADGIVDAINSDGGSIQASVGNVIVSAKALRKAKKDLGKQEQQLAECESKLSAEETNIQAGPMNCGGVAFVTFTASEHAQTCLTSMPINRWSAKNPCRKGKKLRVDGQLVFCCEAPDPENIKWENLGKRLRQAQTSLFSSFLPLICRDRP